MRIPDPKANTTTEAYLAYKAGFLEESELKPSLYEPYLHFDAWLAYWAGLTSDYPKNYGKNLCQELSGFNSISSNGATDVVESGNSVSFTTSANGRGIFMTSTMGNNYTYCPELYSTGYVCSVEISATKASQLRIGVETMSETVDVDTTPKRVSFKCYGNAGERVALIFYRASTSGECSYTISNIQVEKGSEATDFEEYSTTPEMLTDEEALVAYLSGVTDTYPEEIKDPYDVRIVGYLKYLISVRWGRPEYPVNNEEFYLSTMKPAFVPSGDTPSSDIEMDGTVEAPFIDLKMYGDTFQQTYTGKNLLPLTGFDYSSGGLTSTNNGSTVSVSGTTTTEYATITGQTALGATIPSGTDVTLSMTSALPAGVRLYLRIYGVEGSSYTNLAIEDGETSVSTTLGRDFGRYQFLIRSTVGTTLNISNLGIQIETGSTPTSFEPYVGGQSSPNPDYPQAVNTVTGEQTVKVNGKNLSPNITGYTLGTNGGAEYETTDDSIVVSTGSTGTSTNKGIYINKSTNGDYCPEAYTTGYTVSFTVVASAESYFAYRNESQAYNYETIGTTPMRLSFPSGTGNMIFYAKEQNITFTISDFQVEAGSTATAYSPYKQSYNISLASKNLLGLEDVSSTTSLGITYSVTNGVIKINGTASASGRIAIPLVSNVMLTNGNYYTMSAVTSGTVSGGGIGFQLRNTDNTANVIDVLNTLLPYSTNSASGVAGYFALYIASGRSFANYEVQVQLETGDTATPYAPYSEPIELCKINDYQDYIYRDEDGDWYVHKATGKSMLGGLAWSPTAGQGSTAYRMVSTDLKGLFVPPLNNQRYLIGYCSHFKMETAEGTYYYRIGISGSPNGNNIYIWHPDYNENTTESANGLKTWLTNNNVVFYYPLVTPTDTKITDSTLVEQLDALMEGGSYEGKTYIKVTATDPNLPGLLYVEAGKYD